MRIGVPKEIKDREHRVALTPEGARQLAEQGHEGLIQNQAVLGFWYENLFKEKIFFLINRTMVMSLWCSLVLFLSGCVGPLTQWGEEISLVSEAPSFNAADLHGKQVAVLSAVVGFGLEGYSLQVSRSLSAAIASNEQSFTLIPIQTALSGINQHGLASDYAHMISEYTQSGILKRVILEQLGEALNVDYVFQPSMAAFNQFTSGRLSVFGLRLFHTRISTLRLSAQLWDTRTGELVWESSGEGTIATEDMREFRIPFEAIAQRLWGRLLKDLDIKVDYPQKWFGDEDDEEE